jgi:hypothetical protein
LLTARACGGVPGAALGLGCSTACSVTLSAALSQRLSLCAASGLVGCLSREAESPSKRTSVELLKCLLKFIPFEFIASFIMSLDTP